MNILAYLGISHILFGIVLILSKEREKPDYILTAWLTVLMMPFVEQFTGRKDPADAGLIVRFINPSFTLLNGPFLYLYIREVTKQENRSIHYAPHFLIFILYYILLILYPAPLNPGGPRPSSDVPFTVFKYFGAFSALSFMLYGLCSIWILKQHRNRIKETYAWQSGRITLFWLTLIPVLFIGLLSMIILFENSFLTKWIEIGNLHLAAFLLFALYLVFFGLRQKKIFPEPEKKEKKRTEARKEGSDLLLIKLKGAMEEKKLFLNPRLSVYDLAMETGISRHRISMLLNENLSMNFFQFVNRYRLEEVCRAMKEDTEWKHNILELAYDAGFNSKSSFNSLFKSSYGQTPSQYRKSLQS